MTTVVPPRRGIVIAPVGSLGDLFPFLAVGRVMHARGHRVVVATHALHREQVEAAGLAFAETDAIIVPEDSEAFFREAFRRLRGPRFVVRDVAAANTPASYAVLDRVTADADLLLTTTLAFAGPVLAEKRGLRWASAVLAPAGFLSASDPPVTGIGVVDAIVAIGRPFGSLLRATAKRASHEWTAPVRAFRRQLGLPPQSVLGDAFHEGQHSPDLVLAMFPALLGAPQPDWPPHVAQTGFARYAQPAQTLPDAVRRFLDDGPPPLVFTLGSAVAHAGAQFFLDSLRAAERIGQRALLLTGALRGSSLLPRDLPATICVADYAPHAAVFPRASVVIHHGGVGTSAEALRAGRPMLVVPHGFDQPDNAARLCRLGVAESVPARRYDAARAARALQRLLAAPAFAERARACAAGFAADDGADRAADALEALLAES